MKYVNNVCLYIHHYQPFTLPCMALFQNSIKLVSALTLALDLGLEVELVGLHGVREPRDLS